MKRFFSPGSFSWAVFLFAGLLAVRAGEDVLNLQAKLVWGTNETKPKDPRLKPVDRETAERLRTVFKWSNYFEVSQTNLAVAANSTKAVSMSRKCDLRLQNLGKSKIAVELYGEGKLVVNKRQAIKPGELLVLAGDDKNDTAWFVVLRRTGP